MVPGAPWFAQYAEWTLGSLRDILRTGNPYQATGFSNSEQSSASIPDSCTKKTIQGEEIWHRCNPSLIKEWQVAQKLFPLWAVLRRRKSICDCSGEAPQPPWEGCQAWAPFLWTDQRGWQNPVMGGSSAAAPHGSIACKPGQDHCPWHSWVSRQEELEITRCSKMRRTQSLAPFRGPLPVFILSWGMKVSVGEGGISYTGWLVDIYIIISAQFYFRRNLTKCSLNFSLLGITEFPVLLLKLCAEESNCGQGGMSGSGSCACTSRIAAAVVVAAPQGSKLGVTAGESPRIRLSILFSRVSPGEAELSPENAEDDVHGDSTRDMDQGSRFLPDCASLVCGTNALYTLKYALLFSASGFMQTGIFTETESSTYLQNNHFRLCLKCSPFLLTMIFSV